MKSEQHKPHQTKPKRNASKQPEHNKTTLNNTKAINITTKHVKPLRFKTHQNNTKQI